MPKTNVPPERHLAITGTKATISQVAYSTTASAVFLALLQHDGLLTGAREDAKKTGQPMEVSIAAHVLAITDAFYAALAAKFTKCTVLPPKEQPAQPEKAKA